MADYSQFNDNLRRMFYYLMQNQMGEQSLDRQMRYLNESNRLYGERAAENLTAEEASRKRVAEHEHGLKMREKSQDFVYDLMKLPKFDRLSRQRDLTTNPSEREALTAELAAGAELFGTTFEAMAKGEQPVATTFSKLYDWADENKVQQLGEKWVGALGTQRTNQEAAKNRELRRTQGEKTADIQERRLGLDTEKFNLLRDKGIGGGGSGDKAAINRNVGTVAKDMITRLDKQIENIQEMKSDNRGNLTSEAKKEISALGDKIKALQTIQRKAAVLGFDQAQASLALEQMGGASSATTPADDAGLDDQTSANLMLEKAKRAFIQRLVTKWNWSPAKAQAKADEMFRMF